MNNSDYFNKALHDMVFENACGAAIRRLADMSMPVSNINKQLDYPISFERVQRYVWQYYLDNKTLLYLSNKTNYREENGYIIITEPCKTKTFVKEQGAYGKITYRQVIIESGKSNDNKAINSSPGNESDKYIACNFGIIKRKNPDEYKKLLNKLDSNDSAYIDDLPWENKIIYHRMNEKLISICKSINNR